MNAYERQIWCNLQVKLCDPYSVPDCVVYDVLLHGDALLSNPVALNGIT